MFGLSLFTFAPGLVGVTTLVADLVRTLGWNMLAELGQEIKRRQDLEFPLGLRHEPIAGRI